MTPATRSAATRRVIAAMSADAPIATLTTPRLRLRPMTPDDAPVIAAMQTDAEVMAHYGDGRPLTPESAQQTVLKYHVHCRAYDYWAWAVTRADTAEVLGQVTAGTETASDPVVLGFILKRSAWGVGYGPEAVKAVLDHGRIALAWPLVSAAVSPHNHRSLRLCERIGMRKVREELNTHGRPRVIYVAESTRS